MSEVLKKERKYLLILFAAVSLISLLCFAPSMLRGLPLTFGTDIKPQWFEFFTEFKKLLKAFIYEHELPFYSWDLFLGNNFYASKSYYVMGDPYNYLGLLLPGNFFDVARFLTYLKFLVASFGFYFFLSSQDIKPLSKLVVSVAYAFSGWAVFYSGQLVFLSFYSFVPFYLWGLEISLRKNKCALFMLSSALLFSVSWYFFYTLTLITPLYFLYRYFILDLPKEDLLKCIFKHIAYYVIGVMITAVIWLPGVLYVLNTPRFASESPFNIYTYLHFLVSSFIPNHLYIYRNNIFETGEHYNREICVWASSALIVLVPQFLKIFSKKERNLTLMGYGIFFIIGNVKFLDSVMHGFGDPSFRWVFLLVIFNLMNVARILDNPEKTDRKLLWCSFGVMGILLCISLFGSLAARGEPLGYYSPHAILMLLSLAVALLSVICVMKNKRILLSVLVIAEIAVSCLWCYEMDVIYNRKLEEDYTFINNVTSVLQDYEGGFNESLNAINEDNPREFYRVYVPEESIYWSFSHNMSVLYDLKGLMTYDSTYSYSFASMYNLVPEVSAYNSGWIFDIRDQELMNYLNTKYAVVTNSDVLPDNWKLINDDFHYGLKLYENTAYHKLGRTYSKMMSEEEYLKKNSTELFSEYVITSRNSEKIKEYLSDTDSHLENIEAAHNHLTATYYSDKDGFMVISVPYDKGWKILTDGQITDYYEVNGGFIGFPVKEGSHEFAMYFMPRGFKMGLLCTGLGILAFAGLMIYRKKRR